MTRGGLKWSQVDWLCIGPRPVTQTANQQRREAHWQVSKWLGLFQSKPRAKLLLSIHKQLLPHAILHSEEPNTQPDIWPFLPLFINNFSKMAPAVSPRTDVLLLKHLLSAACSCHSLVCQNNRIVQRSFVALLLVTTEHTWCPPVSLKPCGNWKESHDMISRSLLSLSLILPNRWIQHREISLHALQFWEGQFPSFGRQKAEKRDRLWLSVMSVIKPSTAGLHTTSALFCLFKD